MDEHIQSFLELSAKDDLVQLVADKRAAWLWSADGARILWANAAGAAFFSAGTLSALSGLASLERSPARPHISRIAETGLTDKFSIDRLRFYRGLRVMLLTCQCKRVELDSGEAAALIICNDKGIASNKEPVAAFAHLIAEEDATVFVMTDGAVTEKAGRLTGVPEDLDLPKGQPFLSGALDLEGSYHDGILLRLPSGPKIVVLENDALPDDEAQDDLGDTDPADAQQTQSPAPAAEVSEDAGDVSASDEASETSEWLRADDLYLDEAFDGETDDKAGDIDPDTTDGDDVDAETTASQESGEDAAEKAAETTGPEEQVDVPDEPETASEETDVSSAATVDLSPAEETSVDKDIEETVADAKDESDGEDNDEAFVFQPRRRPVRFAWKMDIDQRFTFLSDEFADVLGPDATDIVGATWEDVSARFGLDPRGQIARALDRRDTWSGKTVNWPVTGAALRVPVDMAALPAFDRNRKFEGYRGFGVCRSADAIQDQNVPAIFAGAAPFAAAAATVVITDDAADLDETADMSAANVEDDAAASGDEAADLNETTVQDDAAPSRDDAVLSLSSQAEENVSEGSEEAEATTADAQEPASESAPQTVDAPEEEPGLDEPDAEEKSEAGADTSDKPSQQPQNRLEDLKPLQPDSLKGKTFLGASAAALVGSLAKFTGKPVPAHETPSRVAPKPAEPRKSSDGEDLAEELRAAAAALNKADEEAEKPFDASNDAPASASADDKASTDDDLEVQDAAEDGNEAPADDEIIDSDDSTAADALPEADAAEPEEEEPVVARSDAQEPAGITGPAPLKPAEIESAVKTLAKSYKQASRKSPDLFETPDNQEPADSEEPAAEIDAPDTAHILSEREDDVAAPLLSEDPDAGEAIAGDTETEAPTDETSLSETDDTFDAADEAVLEAAADEVSDLLAEDTDEADDTVGAGEKEFFEETAAFQQEDSAAPSGDDAPPAEKKTGQVIPLATARPRVVPVDTSSLSRPERAAFRKIAEALGARLEGDLDDFESTDQEDLPLEDLPPEVPEAGPIDPSLLDRLPIGIAIVHDREVLYSNKALLRMLGYKSTRSLSESGGLEALFIDDTEDLPDAARMDGEVDETMKMRHADGGIICVDAHMHSVPWNGSRGLMISVTERPGKPASPEAGEPASPNFFAEVRSELESARNQITEMDTILETATDGVLVLDEHGTIVKVNGSAEALFSASRSDMIGAPFAEFLAPESHRAAADYLDGLSKNGVASILNDGREVLGTVPTGGLIPLFMTIGRITSGKDDVKYCAVLRDITQWKTAEEELTQAKRQAENASSQKSDFLAKISHEIRTPLNAIIGFSEVMMEERFGPIGNDRYKDYLKDIRTSGSHIMSLINDLLDLSKIEAGKLDLKFTAVSTNDVINECVALMQPQANRERIIIRASLPESVPDVVADPRSLRQIVLNLLSNAIKYNRSGGQVILSTALENNGEVILRVRDTGTGMTAKQLAAALEPFRQLHTASRGGGTGLGLPLTKALVEANRASFHIDSTPDQGTLVEIVFPTQRVLSE
ncbi:PAS domain-containing protein [Rhodobacterales bacterium]|nr:PAS domain-containing protein [Rhodobacterales bacterium]